MPRRRRGRFRPGPDPRRHVFTPEERRRGYAHALEKLAQQSAHAYAWLWRRVRSYYRQRKGENHEPK
jgi:hypothetical protein